jgi:superoxide reductase
MIRRDFIRFSIAGIGLSAIVPGLVAAKSESATAVGNIFYTKDSPGRWKEKIAGHLPTIEIRKQGAKTTVKIITAHEMKAYEHYIVKHVLLDQDYQFIEEHLFDPVNEKTPVSTFTLENYNGSTIYALSLCNKHDLWLNSATL